MKRIIALIAVLVLLLTGCGENVPSGIIGEWNCREMASDNETDTSFYHLIIEEDGEFSLYDQAAGNPGISGKLSSDEEGKLSLNCDSEDFDPPFCWDIEGKTVLDYTIEENTLSLGYNGIWLTFDKE